MPLYEISIELIFIAANWQFEVDRPIYRNRNILAWEPHVFIWPPSFSTEYNPDTFAWCGTNYNTLWFYCYNELSDCWFILIYTSVNPIYPPSDLD